MTKAATTPVELTKSNLGKQPLKVTTKTPEAVERRGAKVDKLYNERLATPVDRMGEASQLLYNLLLIRHSQQRIEVEKIQGAPGILFSDFPTIWKPACTGQTEERTYSDRQKTGVSREINEASLRHEQGSSPIEAVAVAYHPGPVDLKEEHRVSNAGGSILIKDLHQLLKPFKERDFNVWGRECRLHTSSTERLYGLQNYIRRPCCVVVENAGINSQNSSCSGDTSLPFALAGVARNIDLMPSYCCGNGARDHGTYQATKDAAPKRIPFRRHATYRQQVVRGVADDAVDSSDERKNRECSHGGGETASILRCRQAPKRLLPSEGTNSMVAYNFQARFSDAIQSGEKAITIRDVGKRRHARKGDRVQLYTGQRTKACRKLVDPDPVVLGVQAIRFYRDGSVWADGYLTLTEIETLARLDGFEDGDAFLAFHRPAADHVARKVLIEWEPPRPAVAAEVAA